jgi:hypothetical protein
LHYAFPRHTKASNVSIKFPTDYSPSDQKTFVSGWQIVLDAVKANCADTFTGATGGWVVEDQQIPPSADKADSDQKKPQGKGKAYVALLGWKSADDHINFTKTKPFADNIHHLFKAKDLLHYTMVHYRGKLVEN